MQGNEDKLRFVRPLILALAVLTALPVCVHYALAQGGPVVSSISIPPGRVVGGTSAQGTVTLSAPAPGGGAQIGLSSNTPPASVPSTITVPAGSTSAQFTVNTAIVMAPVFASISATYGATQSATLDVTPSTTPGDWAVFASPSAVTVSSQNTALGQLGSKAVDGIIDGNPGDGTKEWATMGELAGAWIQLTGNRPATIAQVILHDRPNLTDHILGGTLSFSDGSTVPVGALPNDGTGLTVSFPTRSVMWIRFTITSAVGQNTGLSELELFSTSTVSVSLSSLAISPSGVVGGNASQGTLTLSAAAPSGGATVTLSSSLPSVNVPASVTVPAGVTSTTFSINTQTLAAPTVVTVSAAYSGVTRTATLDVTPAITPGDFGIFASAAAISVSSHNTTTGQLGTKAFDGVIDGNPGDATKEWATLGELAGAWIQLTGSHPATIAQVILHDRPNLTDHILGGTLSFSDGSTVPVGALPNDGTGLTVSFAPRSVSWIRFTVTSAVGQNIGLSEFEVFSSGTGGGSPTLSSVSVNPSTMAGGGTPQGTVTLSAAALSGGALVQLSSSSPSIASVPSNVLVPANATSANFSVPTATVSASTTATISATFAGSTLSTSLNLTPAAITLIPRSSVLTFNQTQQFQAAGSNVTNTNVNWSVDGIQGGNSQIGVISPSGFYTPPSVVGSHIVTAISQSNSSLSATSQVYVSNYPGILTQHNDNLRSGQNLQETTLTPTNVNPVQFGKLYSIPVDGAVFAQPLYVPNLAIPGRGTHNVVFIVTEHDSVYAFDADNGSGTPLWQTSFINPASGITTLPPGDIGGGPIGGEIGITSTPVIDPGSATMYVVAMTKENGAYFWRLHALDIATGAEKFGGPVPISGQVFGTGVGSSAGVLRFDPKWHLQRPGLLGLNGVVYIAFGSEGDLGQWHGWLFAFDASTLAFKGIFCTSPNGFGGASWHGGGGVGADASGNVYIATGNGSFSANTGGGDYSDSMVKLKLQPGGGLAVVDYFTPFDQASLESNDEDLGAGGPLLLSDQPGTFPHLLTMAGKGGTLYLVNRDNMGQFQSGSNSQILLSVANEFPGGDGTGVFGTPAEWNGQVFYQSQDDTLKVFPLSNGMLQLPPQKGPDKFGPRGASPSISSNGTANGIVWVLQSEAALQPGPSILHAYAAGNVQQQLYNSAQVASRDAAGVAIVFSLPTVANGKVFVGNRGSFTVYGLLP